MLRKHLFGLDGFQTFILVGSLLMVLIYLAAFISANAREGYLYNDEFLVHSKENGADVYALRSGSFTQKFTVYTEDKIVMYQYGSKTFGPYAFPASDKSSSSPSSPPLDARIKGGILRDTNGNVIWDDVNGTDDWDSPTRQAIADVASGQGVVHLGNWKYWTFAAAICFINIVFVFAPAVSKRPGHIPLSGHKLDLLYGHQLAYFAAAIVIFQKGLHLP